MKNRTPVVCDRCRREGLAGLGEFSAMKPLLDFKPVPRRYRHDGWTPKRQRAFIAALAETGSVSQAAAAVNMTSEGAYYLRRQPGAEEFRAAWDSALDHGADIVDGKALERSIHGVPVPIYQGGKQVGERRVFNERLTMFLLQHRKPEKYGYAKRGDTPATDLERAEAIRSEIIERHDGWMERLSKLYGHRLATERECRRAGNIVAADFYLRQATHMEVLLELGGGGKHLLWWANGGEGPGPGADHSKAIYATEITEMLDSARRKAWERDGEPMRPPSPGYRHLPHGTEIHGGPDLKDREERVKAARAKAAEAQRLWEEAALEEAEARLGEAPETKERSA